MSINKVILIGRLGKNPEIRTTASGSTVANFSIATSESWTDKNGQKVETTEWHKIVVWGKTAENCGQYLTKGKQVYIEGKLQTKQWQDKEGQTKYTTEVLAQNVQFLGAAGEKGSDRATERRETMSPSYESNFGLGNNLDTNMGNFESPISENDIPF